MSPNMGESPDERAVVMVENRAVSILGKPHQSPGRLSCAALCKKGTHHRGRRQDGEGHPYRDLQGHGEFAEHPSHEQDLYEIVAQGGALCEHGEGDFGRAAHGDGKGRRAGFPMARDVLQTTIASSTIESAILRGIACLIWCRSGSGGRRPPANAGTREWAAGESRRSRGISASLGSLIGARWRRTPPFRGRNLPPSRLLIAGP